MKILGVKINNYSFEQTVKIIEEFIVAKKPHYLVTLNPEMVVSAQNDKKFKKIINDADIVVPDGVGIIWAAKVRNMQVKERITGVDLVWELAEIANRKKYKFYLLGAEDNVAKQTTDILKNKFPNVKIVGAETGGKIKSEISSPRSLIERIKKSKPDILLVAFGHQKQEKWISKYKDELNIPLSIGVGGAFDYISGRISRAPKWMRKLGFEWLYRLVGEPWRIKRQLNLLKFIYLVLFC